jgi:hypothetical protein
VHLGCFGSIFSRLGAAFGAIGALSFLGYLLMRSIQLRL